MRARLAKRDGVLKTDWGPMRYRAGKHYIIAHGHDRFVVRRDIFERTYRRRVDALYARRTDIVYRYVIVDEPVLVPTLEGLERANAGDWILQGVAGELWPISKEKAQALYAPTQQKT